jgi:outer membrane protein assembly factor BamB
MPRLAVATLGLGLATTSASAQDWSQWQGPARDGLASLKIAGTWPAELKEKWKVTVGEGYSSPVVAAGKVYVMGQLNEREVVSAVEIESGRLAWQESYSAPCQINATATVQHGLGPKSTPLVSGGRLVTLGVCGVLSSWDATTGKLRWQKDFGGEFREKTPLFGHAMSAAVEAGLLIAHVGGHDEGALSAFDAATGELRWSFTGDGPGYASPIVVDVSGVRQVVTQTQQYIVGLDAVSGKLCWKVPFTTRFVQNIVTPVVHGDKLIFSGLDKGIFALRASRKGSEWMTETVWENSTLSMYMSSPVVLGDLLFGFSHRNKGQFFCLDARSGATLWTSEPRQAENAALVAAGEVLLLLTDQAELIVARASARAFEPLRRYTVAASPTWAHPAPAGSRLLIKDGTSLTLWSLE